MQLGRMVRIVHQSKAKLCLVINRTMWLMNVQNCRDYRAYRICDLAVLDVVLVALIQCSYKQHWKLALIKKRKGKGKGKQREEKRLLL